MKNVLIIVTGLPGTGKTTLGKKIAEKFSLPFVCKDDFKEMLFDVLGSKDREWSQKIGMASYDILYHVTGESLKANKSLIVETNFDPKFANKRIDELQKKYNFIPFQIRCITDGRILLKRFEERVNDQGRHAGHCDADSLEEWEPILKKGKIEALKIKGEIMDINTTDFERLNHEELFDKIKEKLD